MFPYITLDVLLVGFVFAMPLGILIASHIRKLVSNSLAGFIGFGLIGISITLLAVLNISVERGGASSLGYTTGIFGGGAAMRSILAILFWIGGVLVATVIVKGKVTQLVNQIANQSDSIAFFASVVAATLMPLVFVQVRCQHGWKRFEELSESMRIGEARSELLTVLRLAPNSVWQGRTVAEAFQYVQAEYDRIELARQRLPHPPEDSQTVIQQSRYLAILGETDLALSYLQQFPAVSRSADAALLRATIFETRQAWDDAINEYVLGQKQLMASGEPYQISTQWQTALRGEGFCRRKAGDLLAAERAYLKLMQAAPSGSNALLLAYFYEDVQKTSAAKKWIREAVRLEPAYGDEAQRLWGKLATSHFGCFQAYRN